MFEDMRPCYARGEKAIFHTWAAFEKPITDDKGEHIGHIRGMWAVVELMSGKIEMVKPTELQFTDTDQRRGAYAWD